MSLRIGLCALDEVEDLRAFFRNHWSPDHVLARSLRVLDWQHRDGDLGYNFILARTQAGEIIGMLGFIPSGRYDRSLMGSAETIWLTTWKARSNIAPGLGLMLLRTLGKARPSAWIGTVGLNPATRKIYEALGYQTGVLARHYLLNREATSFRLAVVPQRIPEPALSEGTQIKEIGEDSFIAATASLGLDLCEQIPKKTPRLFLERYLRHPFYRYQAWLLSNNNHNAVLITRLCEHADARALRVVDFLGEKYALSGAGWALQNLLITHSAEYLDFYCSGLSAELITAGLRDIREDDTLILPSHFEPFEPRNVELQYSIKGPGGHLVICKGDADQDRPNLLDELTP